MKPQGQNKQLFVRSKIYTIISGRVSFDLIFCLVLIKELLHYLISPNWVTRWDGDQCNSAKKAFEHSLANLAHRCIFCCSGGRGASVWCHCWAPEWELFQVWMSSVGIVHKQLSKMLDMLHIPQLISGGNRFRTIIRIKACCNFQPI